MSRVLVLSPHPDDEAIGCGGTIRAHVVDGDAVRVAFLTSGERGCRGADPAETARTREAEATAAGGVLGVAGVEFWRLPDGAVRATRPAVERLRALVASWRPDVVYTTHAGEQHPDHRAAARLVRRALGGPAPPLVRYFEVWTPLAEMDAVVDVTPHVAAKVAAIRAHASQCAVVRFDEAALALSRYRGEMHSWPGGPYAEVFREGRP